MAQHGICKECGTVVHVEKSNLPVRVERQQPVVYNPDPPPPSSGGGGAILALLAVGFIGLLIGAAISEK